MERSSLFNEQLITLSAAARVVTEKFPGRRAGKKTHTSTLFRWHNRGLRGVKLEAIAVGGTKMTSVDAINRFIARLSGDESDPTSTDAPSVSKSNSDQQRRIAAAEKLLARAGVN